MNTNFFCPECESFSVELYQTNVILETNYFRCKTCGHIWTEPLINNRNKFSKKEELRMKIKQIKKGRIKYPKWNKIKTNDVVNALLDLFELGGRKFSKRKKRRIDNEQTKRNRNSR